MNSTQSIRVEVSLDGDGHTVVAGDARWRFNRKGFATLFQSRLEADEDFRVAIFEHAFVHDWDFCEIESCLGRRWQEIQSL